MDIVDEVGSYQDGPEALRTADGRKALIQITTSLVGDDDLEPGDAILDIVEASNESSGLRVTSIGQFSVERLFGEMVEETFTKGEMIGIIAALVIMLIVFGAVVAALDALARHIDHRGLAVGDHEDLLVGILASHEDFPGKRQPCLGVGMKRSHGRKR